MNQEQMQRIFQANIGDAGKALAVWLLSIAGDGVVRRTSVQELARSVNKSESSVSKSLRELEDAGLVDVDRYKAGSRDPDLNLRGDLRVYVLCRRPIPPSAPVLFAKEGVRDPELSAQPSESNFAAELECENGGENGVPNPPRNSPAKSAAKSDPIEPRKSLVESFREMQESGVELGKPALELLRRAEKTGMAAAPPCTSAPTTGEPPGRPNEPALAHVTRPRARAYQENNININIIKPSNIKIKDQERAGEKSKIPEIAGNPPPNAAIHGPPESKFLEIAGNRPWVPGLRARIMEEVEAAVPDISPYLTERIAIAIVDLGWGSRKWKRWKAGLPNARNPPGYLHECLLRELDGRGISTDELDRARKTIFRLENG